MARGKIQKYLSNKNAGNALLTVLVIAAIAGMAGTALLTLSSKYIDTSQDQKLGAKALAERQFVLNLFSEKFRIVGKTPPLWYPDPYPSDLSAKPIIQVISQAPDLANNMVPITLPATSDTPTINLILDITKMASVVEPKYSSSSSNKQIAYFAVGDFESFGSDNYGNFINHPDSRWPASQGVLANLKTHVLSFNSYGVEKNSPKLVSYINVVIGTKDGKTKGTSATLMIDPPPAPSCQINLAAGLVQPLRSGTSASFSLQADSIVGSATFNGTTIPVSSTQSIRNLGIFRDIASGIASIVPDAATLPAKATGEKYWLVKGTVTDASSKNTSTCSKEIIVENIKPEVTLTADAAQLSYAGKTNLRWTSKNAQACVLSSSGALINVNKSIPLQGTVNTGSLPSDATVFTVTCSNSGISASASVTINVKFQCQIVFKTYGNGNCRGMKPEFLLAYIDKAPAPLYTNGWQWDGECKKDSTGTIYHARGGELRFSHWPRYCNVTPMPITVFPYKGLNYQFGDGKGTWGTSDCSAVTFNYSPLVIDLQDEGISLTAPNDGPLFDLSGENFRAHYSWPSNGENSAFLVYDANANGEIENIQEMFGDNTVGPDGKKSANGFEALKKYDLNHDGMIDSKDAIYKKLSLWFDKNANGKTERNELYSLEDKKVKSIDLSYLNMDEMNDYYGNLSQQRSVISMENGQMHKIFDIWVVKGNHEEDDRLNPPAREISGK